MKNPAATGAPDVQFTLTDTPADLPTGVTLAEGTNWTAAAGTGAPVVTEAERPDSGDWTIALGTLEPGESAVYTVSATVEVAILSQDATDEKITGQCEDTGPWGILLPNGAEVTSGGFEAEDEGCAVVPPSPEVWIDKTFSSAGMDPDGIWTVVYDITVTNVDSQQITTYTLSDTLRFGEGIEIEEASWVGPEKEPGEPNLEGTWDTSRTNSAVLATNRALAPASTETYTVTVKATIPGKAWSTGSLVCTVPSSDTDSGFLNEATVTFPGGENTDEDCETPTRPNLNKSFVSATQDDTDPELWHVAYAITVTGEDHDSFYDLADAPGFPEGVDLIAGTASLEDDLNGPWDLPIDGTSFREAVPIEAGEAHECSVVWTVEIDELIQGDAATCAPGQDSRGFFNLALMTVAAAEISDEAYSPIVEAVASTASKTVTSTVQNSDDTWTITYDVAVKLPTGELNPNGQSAEYDLTDELRFGEGITVTDASWTGPEGASGTFGNQCHFDHGHEDHPRQPGSYLHCDRDGESSAFSV